MSESAIQPLRWDGDGVTTSIQEHALAGIFPEIVRLIGELGECIDEGLDSWRNAYWDEERAYRNYPPLGLGSDEWQELDELEGYTENIRAAASAIFYGFGSAKQYHDYGHYQSLAEAIRHHAFPDNTPLLETCKRPGASDAEYLISDRQVYALAAATEAWWVRDSLIRWLDEGYGELTETYEAQPPGHPGWLQGFATIAPEDYSRLLDKYRRQWALSEAEEREYAARRLGTTQRLLMLAAVADDLSQAALNRASLSALEQKHAEARERNRTNGSLGGRPANIDREAVHEAARKLREGGTEERNIAGKLASRFGCTAKHIRGLLKSNTGD